MFLTSNAKFEQANERGCGFDALAATPDFSDSAP
jgi:hypothetical protein